MNEGLVKTKAHIFGQHWNTVRENNRRDYAFDG